MAVTTAVKVTVAPERIALSPGESADIEVTIQNASRVVEHFATSVLGLPGADCFTVDQAVVKLLPKETGTVRLQVRVPERGGMVSGLYTLGVLVRSPYQQDVSRCEELPLDVRPTPRLAMTVQPELVTGGGSGSYVISVANEGNTPLAVTLAGTDQENRVGFDFEPRALQLPPGAYTSAQLAVRADPPLTGQEVRRNLTLNANAGELSVTRPVVFAQRPRIAGGLMRVAGLAAGIAVLAGATVGGAVLIRGAKQANVAQAAAVATSAAARPATAGNTTTQQPTTTAAPAQPPPASSSTPASQPSTSAVPPNSTIVDFTRLPSGQPDGDQIIPGTLYSASGITLSTVTQTAPPDCQDATALALRTAGQFGSFLTSARPAGVDLCNTMPVRVDFAKPVKSVRVNFLGLGANYVINVQLSDGSTDSRTAASVQGTITNVEYDAPATASITSISFGHASTDPTDKDPTIVKSLTYVPE